MQAQYSANEGDRATAVHRGWLASYLLRRSAVIVPRFLHFYRRVQQRIRGWSRPKRRVLWRRPAAKVASALTGVALLLALSRAPARAANITVVNGEVDINDNGVCSLIEAIINAEDDAQTHDDCVGGSGADTITLPTDGSFTLMAGYGGNTGLPAIDETLTIEGNGSTIRRDTADPDHFRFLVVNDFGDLTLNDLILEGGYSPTKGGAIFNDGTLAIYDSTIRGNYSDDDGGALAVGHGTVTITNSTISGNTAADDGGGIYNYEGTVTITNNSTVSNNYAAENGGGIYNDEGTVMITDSALSGNVAHGDAGGGIYNDEGMLTITSSVISGNHAGLDGGGIYNDLEEATLNINDSTISGNWSGHDGGGLNNWQGTVTITSSTINDNYAAQDGGGIYNDHEEATLTIINSTISYNEADNNGGGLYNWHGMTTITNSTISHNVAGDGGGGVYNEDGATTFNRTLVSGNTADIANEVYNEEGTVNADNYNLFGHSGETDAEAFNNFSPGATDINATSSDGNVALSAILDPFLASNGGPTKTHALVPNSPALDAAPSADCSASPVDGVDQRGEARNADADSSGSANECDIGAFEGYQSSVLLMTAAGPGTTTDGVNFGKEDILSWDGSNWSLFFDGSTAGLTTKHDLNAIDVNAADDLYLSFFQNKIKTTTLGNVMGTDILHYDGSAFSVYFDGSDVGLNKVAQEKIDALHILDGDVSPIGGSCEAYLLISTLGTGKVPAFGGGTLNFRGEDILGFCLTNSGSSTAGFWHMVLDGSAEGLPKNSTDSINASGDGELIYLTTKVPINVDDAFGGHSMVYRYNIYSSKFSGPIFSAPANGLNQKVDGLAITQTAAPPPACRSPLC